MDQFIGTVMLWSGYRIPKDWMLCNGALLEISEYEALFSIIGNRFGGDGRTNFALPNLCGAVPVGTGRSRFDGMTYELGETGGSSSIGFQLTNEHLPSHTHSLSSATAEMPTTPISVTMEVSTEQGQRQSAQNNDYIGATTDVMGRDVNLYRDAASSSATISGLSGVLPAQDLAIDGDVSNTGLGKPMQMNHMPPHMAMNYIIAVDGLYPQFT